MGTAAAFQFTFPAFTPEMAERLQVKEISEASFEDIDGLETFVHYMISDEQCKVPQVLAFFTKISAVHKIDVLEEVLQNLGSTSTASGACRIDNMEVRSLDSFKTNEGRWITPLNGPRK